MFAFNRHAVLSAAFNSLGVAILATASLHTHASAQLGPGEIYAAIHGYCGDGRAAAPEACDPGIDASCAETCDSRPGLTSCADSTSCARGQSCGDANGYDLGLTTNGDTCWPGKCDNFWYQRGACGDFDSPCGQCPPEPACNQDYYCDVQCEATCSYAESSACKKNFCGDGMTCAAKAQVCANNGPFCPGTCTSCEKVCPVEEKPVCLTCEHVACGYQDFPDCSVEAAPNCCTIVLENNCDACGFDYLDNQQVGCRGCWHVKCGAERFPIEQCAGTSRPSCNACGSEKMCPTAKVDGDCKPAGCSQTPVPGCVKKTDCDEYEACAECLGCVDSCSDAPCACIAKCNNKACGDDGCGGHCGVCGAGQPGAQHPYDCLPGLVVGVGFGPAFGFAEGTNVCVLEVCMQPGDANPCTNPANAGVATICGICPPCNGSCAGKECGDNGCGVSCGSVPAGQYCDGDGKLQTGSSNVVGPPITLTGTPPQTSTAGRIEGTFKVDDFGHAIYDIPIRVPPGRQGIAPNLALHYDSSGGNGYLGVGWSVSGLSVIARCPKTIAQDGATGRINFNDTDRFCRA
jgi:Salmonella virulence plasmid 65kDa B protein